MTSLKEEAIHLQSIKALPSCMSTGQTQNQQVSPPQPSTTNIANVITSGTIIDEVGAGADVTAVKNAERHEIRKQGV